MLVPVWPTPRTRGMIGTVYDVTIRDDSIRLGQFLKLANLIESGAEAKEVIADGLVTVNGEVETRRGRQLTLGDVVEVGGMSVRVAREEV
ncbi:hypothetical protein GONAM_35_00280 [Gordonia namibiensis NBRC 108229]|uniref:RNA-binding S4 domain-containing protein n=2 Tax=Gordonia namibiensis TaxID=168480 RepID=K6XBV5_9ACTN|nr:hypothetical protein GONAM_35_00280 [Gordonia namibiensis NBRC 108229]